MAVHLDRAARGWVRETKRGGEGCDVCLSAARARIEGAWEGRMRALQRQPTEAQAMCVVAPEEQKAEEALPESQ